MYMVFKFLSATVHNNARQAELSLKELLVYCTILKLQRTTLYYYYYITMDELLNSETDKRLVLYDCMIPVCHTRGLRAQLLISHRND